MNTNFVKRFAPKLALPEQGGATPQIGTIDQSNLQGIDHPFDERGNPLPFAEVNGRREYFGRTGPSGQVDVFSEQGAAMPFQVQPGGQRQYIGTTGSDGLRDRTPVGIPDMPAPQDMLRGRLPVQEPVAGLRGLSPVDEVPPNREVPPNFGRIGPDMSRVPYSGPRASVRIPPVSGQNNERVPMQDWYNANRGVGSVGGPNDSNTLQDLLDQFNFQIPSVFGQRRRGTGSFEVVPQEGVEYINNFEGRRPAPNFSTPEGLAEFNRYTGLNLNSQVRTQREQDRLRALGFTNAVQSFHVSGQAFDIPTRNEMMRDDNGRRLTGDAAVRRAREIVARSGYDVDNFQFIWKSGHGTNQGTGAHVHVEPIGSPGRPGRR